MKKNIKKVLALALALLLTAALPGLSALADGVPPTSLADMLAAAAEGDTITLQEDMAGNVTIDKAITLDLNGHTLSGDGTASVIQVSIQNASEGSRLTIQNGTITGGGGVHGGGIQIFAATTETGLLPVDLTGLTVTGNSASNAGGGVYQMSGDVTLSGCTISNNSAGDSGGGYYQSTHNNTAGGSACTLVSGSISYNTAISGGGVAMGANNYAAEGDKTASFLAAGGSISGNTATGTAKGSCGGGGVYLVGTGSRFTLAGASVTGNTANGNGGGIYSTNWFGVTISAGLVSGNTVNKLSNYGGNGGGVYLLNTTATALTAGPGATITGNTAALNGGGVYSDKCSVSIADGAALYNNTAASIADDFYSSSATVTLPAAAAMSGDLTLASDGIGITGWYHDGYQKVQSNTIRARWGATYEAMDMQQTIDQGKLVYVTYYNYAVYSPVAADTTTTLALKAAHDPYLTYKVVHTYYTDNVLTGTSEVPGEPKLLGTKIDATMATPVPEYDNNAYTLTSVTPETELELALGAENTITLRYDRTTALPYDPAPSYYTLTVRHLDEDGNELASTETSSHLAGVAYSTGAATIEGYAFKEMGAGSDAASGYMTSDKTVAYVYAPTTVIDGGETPLEPTPPVEIDPVDPPLDDTPKTGDAGLGSFLWLALCLSLAGLVTLGFSRKRRFN